MRIKQTVVSGSKTPLDQFAVSVAATLSLMLVTVLLAAALLALEREEGVFARLRRLVSANALLAEKILLAAAAALVVTLLQLAVIRVFVALDFQPLALAAGALAFAALGTALGALAREVRVASLLAVLLALPLAFLALIPSGAVNATLFDALNIISGAFPFKPTLRALDGDAAGLRAPGRAGRGLRGRRARSPAPVLSLRKMAFPATRLRRLRQTGVLRGLVRETELSVSHLVYPMFVMATGPKRTPIAELPGIDHLSIDGAVEEAGIAHALGIPAVLLFGLPASKDPEGSGAWDDEGVIQLATRAIKASHPGPAGLHRPLPVRVHLARPLRRAARRRRRRQRPDARAARPHRGLAGRGGSGRRRAQRHDGRPRRRPARARSTSTG